MCGIEVAWLSYNGVEFLHKLRKLYPILGAWASLCVPLPYVAKIDARLVKHGPIYRLSDTYHLYERISIPHSGSKQQGCLGHQLLPNTLLSMSRSIVYMKQHTDTAEICVDSLH